MSRRLKTALIHSALFIVTFITTTIAGSFWTAGASIFSGDGFNINTAYSWADFATGLPYSITFLLILTVHEFGHYFTAMYHRVKATLPYYIPLPPFPLFLGTLGALIRIKSRIHSTTQNFDIGLAGPLAGFVVAVAMMFYGFLTLPEPEYIFSIHPAYEQYGLNYADHVYSREYLQAAQAPDLIIGDNILFWLFENFVADPARVPNHHELTHFPILFAAFLSLVFTSLNLLPIGQLDGGHVLYGLVGYKRHKWMASVIFCLFLFYATLGMLVPGEEMNVMGYFTAPHYASIVIMIALLFFCLKGLRQPTKTTLLIAIGMFTLEYAIAFFFPKVTGYSGWLLFAMLIGRMMPVAHPPTEIEEPLTTGRKILGWIALLIFVLCLTPRPIDIIIGS
jgi:membrane-associated protease RseP (regulator of RpoE activity)